MDTIRSSINYSINQDIYNLLYSLHHQYQIDLETLLYRYMPSISIENKVNKQPRKNKKKTKHRVAPPSQRCMARCWGGYKSVKYHKDTKQWKYGYQCHRRKTNLYDYCGTHLKEINMGYLTHGRIDGPVPHPHYNKYQKKIEIQNAMKKV